MLFLAEQERLELSRRLPDLHPQQGCLVTNLSTTPNLISKLKQVFFCLFECSSACALLWFPKTRYPPLTRACFDRCANPFSLYPPSEAVESVARHQLEYYSKQIIEIKSYGGEEGIRTLGSCESLVFKTSSLNHSDTSPQRLCYFTIKNFACQLKFFKTWEYYS